MTWEDERTALKLEYTDPGVRARDFQLSLVVLHEDQVQLFPLQPDRPVTIGRGQDATIQFQDSRLSRRHARFELSAGRVTVEDLGSTNGTLVNGQAIRACALGRDDRVTLGSVTVSLHVMPGQLEVTDTVPHHQFTAAAERAVAARRDPESRVALLMARFPRVADSDQILRWCRTIRPLLPTAATLAAYSRDTVEILLPDIEPNKLAETLESLRGVPANGKGTLQWGVATCPDTARSAEDLHGAARDAVRRATPKDPVGWAPPRDSTSWHQQEVEPGKTVAKDYVVSDPAMEAVCSTAQKVANSEIPILLWGETGVGKEIVARLVHEASKRRAQPMLSVNCGAITDTLIESRLFGHERGAFTGAVRQTKGVFEEASGGTLLLDEIGELSVAAQIALLRVLETKRITRVGSTRQIKVDVRVLAATNRDLEQMSEQGTFRSDLLFRLNAVTLKIPPLRERPKDIVALAWHFLEQANSTNECRVAGFVPEVMTLFRHYGWPGNVRELRNVIERAVVLAGRDEIRVEHLAPRILEAARPATAPGRRVRKVTVPAEALPDEVPARPTVPRDRTDETCAEEFSQTFKEQVQLIEDALIGEALLATSWNKAAAARSLQIPLRTLKAKVRARAIAEETHDPDQAAVQLAKLRERVTTRVGLEFKQIIELYETSLIEEALEASGGNKTEAARALKMPLETLKDKVRRYRIEG